MSNSPPADPCLPTGPLVPGCPHSAPPARILPTGERTGGWPGSVPDRPWWAFRLPAPASDRVTKQPIKPRSVRGEVSERLKELVSKTSVRVTPYRGFESPPLRSCPVRTAGSAVLAGFLVRRCHKLVTLQPSTCASRNRPVQSSHVGNGEFTRPPFLHHPPAKLLDRAHGEIGRLR